MTARRWELLRDLTIAAVTITLFLTARVWLGALVQLWEATR